MLIIIIIIHSKYNKMSIIMILLIIAISTTLSYVSHVLLEHLLVIWVVDQTASHALPTLFQQQRFISIL